MKKLVCVMLALVCVFGCMGCGKESSNNKDTPLVDKPEYIEVASISYGTYDKSTTIYSKVAFTFSEIEIIDKTEYDSATNKKFEPKNFYNINQDKTLDIPKINLDTFKLNELEQKLLNQYLYFTINTDLPDYTTNYYKQKIAKIEQKIICIKVINDRSFYIKTYDGKESLISTDYFEIKYFMN